MAQRKVIHLYKLHPSMKETQCFYCGALGGSKDHVPPVSSPDNFEEEDRFIVRSCIMCNCFLSNRNLSTLLSRCDFLFEKYQRKFRRVLSIPFWSQDEIDELSGKLKRSVILGIKKKLYIENKLEFISNNIKCLNGYFEEEI